MTHTPPIPAGNTSPYPLRELPHAHTSHPLPVVSQDQPEDHARRRSTMLLVGGAAVIGIAAAMVRLMLFLRTQHVDEARSAARRLPLTRSK